MKYLVKVEVHKIEEIVEATSAWNAAKKEGALSGGDNYFYLKDGEDYCHNIEEVNIDAWLLEKKKSRTVSFVTKNERHEWETYVVRISSRIPKLGNERRKKGEKNDNGICCPNCGAEFQQRKIDMVLPKISCRICKKVYFLEYTLK